jgi:hypothetical protein
MGLARSRVLMLVIEILRAGNHAVDGREEARSSTPFDNSMSGWRSKAAPQYRNRDRSTP